MARAERQRLHEECIGRAAPLGRMELDRRTVLAGLVMAPSVGFAQSPPAFPLGISAPMDHDTPSAGTFDLQCEWGAPPRSDRPTAIIVADAQQFYVRPGGAARLQSQLFGADLNVLTIVGRSRSPAIERLVRANGWLDVPLASRLLNWRQWVGDLAAVIAHLRLPADQVALYGRSGGAHLIHQFLTRHDRLASRAFVQAAVNSELDVAWGLGSDSFWSEIRRDSPEVAAELLKFVVQHPTRRRDLVLVLQRQNFFEPLEALPAARVRAIRAFLAGDESKIAEMLERYQINAIAATRDTLEGIGAAKRIGEFARPHPDPRHSTGSLSPSIEALFYFGEPFVSSSGTPAEPTADYHRLRDQSCEVLQIAGRWDHTADYRTQIGLAGLTRNSKLVILDDNHVFDRWTSSGLQPGLIQAFMAGGLRSNATQDALKRLAPLVWNERSLRPE